MTTPASAPTLEAGHPTRPRHEGTALLPGPRPSRRLFLLICVLFLAGALFNSFVVRLHYAPDEPEHLSYVRILATQLRFPHPDESKEAHQAPLNYLIASVFYRLFLPAGVGAAEHAARLVSVVCGLLVLILVWRIASLALPGSPHLWLLATAVVAFEPYFLYLMGVCNNDTLFTLTGTAVFLAVVRCSSSDAGIRDHLILGATLGLAVLSKYLGWALWLLPVALALIPDKETPARLRWQHALIAWGVAVLVVLPWLIHNLIAHGSLLYDLLQPSEAERAWALDRARNHIVSTSIIHGTRLLLMGTFGTFWAADWVVMRYTNTTVYSCIAVLLAAFPLCGLALLAMRAKRVQSAPQAFDATHGPPPVTNWRALGLIALGAVLIFCAVDAHALRWDFSIFTMGGRYQMTSISLLGLSTAAAVRGYTRSLQAQRWLAIGVTIVYLTLAVLSLAACYDFYTSGQYFF